MLTNNLSSVMESFNFNVFPSNMPESSGPFTAQLQQFTDFTPMPAGLSPFQNFSSLFTPGPNATKMDQDLSSDQGNQTTPLDMTQLSGSTSAESCKERAPKKFTFDLKAREASRNGTPVELEKSATKVGLEKSTSSVA